MMIYTLCYHCTIQCGITIAPAVPGGLATLANGTNYGENGDGWIRTNEKTNTFTNKIAVSDYSNHLICWVEPLPYVFITRHFMLL